nr:MAG TPA: phosphoribosylformylglycinamidine synthase II [Bacteriophage sp.]DAP68917.1 MAG TPA: phosphoribosylformylglycinamidine synthase II [Caudoviricetes sp.]
MFIGWPQFDFDHNAIKKVWRTIQRNALNKN